MLLRDKYKFIPGWEFLFLGANIDAIQEAGRFGIDASHAVNYECDSEGTELNYRVLAKAVTQVRESAGCCSAVLSEDWKAEIETDYKRRHRR